jgi:pantoate--beta-alanine ligase
MEIFKQIAPLKAFLNEIKHQQKSIGLVPTMGALHRGHLSLIAASKAQNDITVATIYVNPAQFNNADDLRKYPRTLDKDTQLLQEVRCDVVFCPEDREMYPKNVSLKLDFGHLDQVMEGKFRPGHFSGVGLVVSKLFHIVEPNYAYFGQKDWQQFAVINELCEQLKFNLNLQSIPTLRERDGLALSSRNQRLTTAQREHASVFYKALLNAKELFHSSQPLGEIRRKVAETVEAAPGFSLEYFELADSKNLKLLENVSEAEQPIMCIAGYAGEVRLIDNMFVK